MCICWLAVSAAAQDANMVRAAARSFETDRGTLLLTPAQRAEAGQLEQEAQRETQAGRFGEALRRYAHAAAAMRGMAWTPAVEFAASLQGRIDHAMLDPGQPVTLSLVALYPCEAATGAGLAVSVFLTPPGTVLAQGAAVEPRRLPFATRLVVPRVANGDYMLEACLQPPAARAPEALRDLFRKALPVHIEPLQAEAQLLRSRLQRVGRRDSPAWPSAEYPLEFYDRADRGQEGVRRYRGFAFAREFAASGLILDALEKGRDPFAETRGDFRKAYRSAVDQTLQPYRIFVPESYDGRQAVPLLVALRGAGGDENSMFDGFPGASLAAEAARVGFLVACPRGRGPSSGYRGAAEQDVFDVIAEVRRDYRIDAARIYLMGHSMGAYATWRLAIGHPDFFAALGPIAGGGDPAAMAQIRHIPQYVVHGAEDRSVPVAESRAMVEAGRRAGASIVYVEVPGGGHVDAAGPQFAPMLDFFARQKR